MNLTPKQLEVAEFIQDFRARNAYGPTLEEIARHFGVSKITVHERVRALIRKGVMKHHRYQSRSFEVVSLPRRNAVGVLPLLGAIAAGKPIEAVEERQEIDVAALLQSDRQPFVLRVQGESMIDEQIRSGDYVIVERRNHAQNGETVVALVDNGEATLKKFYRDPDGRVRLQPANPSMAPIFPDRCEIQGVVIGVIRKY